MSPGPTVWNQRKSEQGPQPHPNDAASRVLLLAFGSRGYQPLLQKHSPPAVLHPASGGSPADPAPGASLPRGRPRPAEPRVPRPGVPLLPLPRQGGRRPASVPLCPAPPRCPRQGLGTSRLCSLSNEKSTWSRGQGQRHRFTQQGENGPGAKLRGPRGPGGGVLSRPGRLSLQSLSPSDPYIRARASPCRWVNRGTPQGMGRDWRLAVSCPSRLRTGTRGSQLHTFPARPSASSAGLGSGTAGRGPLMLLLPLPWGCRRAARRPICRQRSVVGRKLGPTLFPEASHCSGRLPTRAWAPRPRPSWTSVSVHPGPSLPPEGRDGQQPAAQGVAGRGGRGWG